MAINTQVNAILNKKMNRQEFLKHVAIGVVAVSGAGAALRLLQPKHSTKSTVGGYGASAYGGSVERSKVG